MRTAWRQSLMALVLGLAVMSGLARGDEKLGGKPVSSAAGETVVEGAQESAPRLFSRWRNRTPLGCYGHFNDYSVGSFCSEFSFLFGGARTFYGERCLKGPPPSPVPGFDPLAEGLDRRGGGVGFGLKHDGNGGGLGFGCGCRK